VKKAHELARTPWTCSFTSDDRRCSGTAGRRREGLRAAGDGDGARQRAVSDDEKGNYVTILVHLAEVYREQNRPDQAIATYERWWRWGGDLPAQATTRKWNLARGARLRQGCSRGEDSRGQAAEERGAKLTLARQLADTGHADEGWRWRRA